MTAIEIAGLLKDYGLQGFCALLVVAVIILFSRLQESQAAQIRLVERLVTALEAAKDASSRLEQAQRSLEATLETRGQTVGDLSQQIKILAEKMTHGFGNLGQSLESFVRLVERERDRGDRGRPS